MCINRESSDIHEPGIINFLTHLPLDKMVPTFTDDSLKRIFLNENIRILIQFSLKFVPKGPTNNIPALV